MVYHENNENKDVVVNILNFKVLVNIYSVEVLLINVENYVESIENNEEEVKDNHVTILNVVFKEV